MSPTGRVVMGKFSRGEPRGAGVVIEPDGTRLSGTFEQGELEGEVFIRRPDGTTWEGAYRRGLPVEGVETAPDGTVTLTP